MKTAVIACCAVLALAACQTPDKKVQDQGAKTQAGTAHDPVPMIGAHHGTKVMAAWMFDQQDADKNGIVTRAERAAAPHQKWLTEFSRLDLNGDGQLDRNEYIQAVLMMHSRSRGQEV